MFFYHKNKINRASYLRTFAQKHIANRAIMVYNFLAFSLVDGICKQTSCRFDWLDFDKQPFQCYLQACEISFQIWFGISQNQFKIKVFKSERNSQIIIYQWGKLHLVPGHCVKSERCLLTVNKAEKYFKD